MSDLAFHALREYVPGDDLRHVHWRSSAKASTLQIRQYHDTRRSHMTVVLDASAASYADPEDFETAVSVAASIAARAYEDGVEVSMLCGDHAVTGRGLDGILDACCRIEPGDSEPVQGAREAMRLAPETSWLVVVSGGAAPEGLAGLVRAGLPDDVSLLCVRADGSAATNVSRGAGTRLISLRTLDDLPRALPAVVQQALGVTRPPRRVVVVDALVVLVLVGLAELGLANTFEGWGYLVGGGCRRGPRPARGRADCAAPRRRPRRRRTARGAAVRRSGRAALEGAGSRRARCADARRRAAGHAAGAGASSCPPCRGSTCRAPRRWCPSCSATSGPCWPARWPCGPAAPEPRWCPLLAMLVDRPAGPPSGGHRQRPARLVPRGLRGRRGRVARGPQPPGGPGRLRAAVRARGRVARTTRGQRRGRRGAAGRGTADHSVLGLGSARLRGHRPAGEPRAAWWTSPRWTRRCVASGPSPTRAADVLENVHDKVLFTVARRAEGQSGAAGDARSVRRPRVAAQQQHRGRAPRTTRSCASTAGSTTPSAGRPVRASVAVTRAYRSAWMPTVGSLTSLQLIFADPREQRDEMRYNLATATAVLPTGARQPGPLRVHLGGAAVEVDASTPGWEGRTQPVRGAAPARRLPAGGAGRADPADAQGLRPRAATCATRAATATVRLPASSSTRPGQDLDRARRRLPARPHARSATTSSTPPRWPCWPTGSAYPRGWWSGAVLPGDGKVRGADVHAWVELRVARRQLADPAHQGVHEPDPGPAQPWCLPWPAAPGAPRRPPSGQRAARRSRAARRRRTTPIRAAGRGVRLLPVAVAARSCSWSVPARQGRPSSPASHGGTGRGPDRRRRGPSWSTTPVTSGSRSGCTPPDRPRRA